MSVQCMNTGICILRACSIHILQFKSLSSDQDISGQSIRFGCINSSKFNKNRPSARIGSSSYWILKCCKAAKLFAHLISSLSSAFLAIESKKWNIIGLSSLTSAFGFLSMMSQQLVPKHLGLIITHADIASLTFSAYSESYQPLLLLTFNQLTIPG